MSSAIDLSWVREGALAAGLTEEDLLEAEGPPKCWSCRGAEVARCGSLCPACDAARYAEERKEAIAKAWRTVPRHLYKATIFADGVISPGALKLVADRDALERAAAIARDVRCAPYVTFAGPPEAGKTTLACLLLREWIRLGSKLKSSTQEDIRIARTARFTSATDLIEDRAETKLGEHVVSIDLAEQAGVLVLDEVGRGKDMHGVIFSLVHKRMRAGMPTIYTTPCRDEAEFQTATGDAGLARRVFKHGVLITLKRPGEK